MKEWRRIEPTTVTKVAWRTIVTKTFIMPSGNKVEYGTFWPEGQEFAGIIPLTKDNKVVISRQYRAGPERVLEELPGGFVDKGETSQAVAERELLE